MAHLKEVPCDKQVVVRMPSSMLERVDLVIDRMKTAALLKGDHSKISRSDAIREVLDGALPKLPVVGERIG